MTTQRILILMNPTPGDDRFYSRWAEVAEITEKPEQATIVITDHNHPIDGEFLANRCPKAKFIISPNTGHTHLRFDPEVVGVEILSLRGEAVFLSEVRSVAEFTMGLVLDLARPKDGATVGTLLNNKVLGIVGLGRIGKQLSVIASGFGMRVTHVDKDSPEWAWTSLFQRSDFVSLHIPECPENDGRIGRKLLEQMKPTSFLINTARASVLDEMALSQLLAEGKIKGAALDVTEMNWMHFPQVITTPHIAGFTLEDRVKTDEFVLEKLKQRIGTYSRV